MIKSKLILMLCSIGITFYLSTKVLASNNTQRIWGNDRYATAIEVSKGGWTDGSEYAVLANGENFPDALAGSAIAAKEGHWIYYTDGYSRLYKSKDDESSTIKLIDIQEDAASHSRISDINVLGEWIYYTEGYDINKIKIDGTSKTKIDEGFLLALIGNTVYYINVSDNNEIYKMKLDGSNKTKVRDEAAQQMIIGNSFIYYPVNGGVYRMKPDNSDVVCIVNNHNNGVTFNVSSDCIYYTMGEGNLYKIKSDGSSNVKVADVNAFKLTPGTSSIFFPTIVEDWTYYECDVHTSGDDYFTYKCKVKTNDSENNIINPKYR